MKSNFLHIVRIVLVLPAAIGGFWLSLYGLNLIFDGFSWLYPTWDRVRWLDTLPVILWAILAAVLMLTLGTMVAPCDRKASMARMVFRLGSGAALGAGAYLLYLFSDNPLFSDVPRPDEAVLFVRGGLIQRTVVVSVPAAIIAGYVTLKCLTKSPTSQGDSVVQ